MSDGVWTYVAVESCGCVTGMSVDMVTHVDRYSMSLSAAAKGVAKDIAELERGGRTVERRFIARGEMPILMGWPESCPHRAEEGG